MKRIGFVSILAAAILGCQGDQPLTPPGRLSADIQDALHNEGNLFFFWLPPTVQQQQPATQVFSRDLRPVVTIRDCTGALVRKFEGPQIQVSNDHYLANWDTQEDDLDVACDYRITVTAASTELGFADVNVVGSGQELRNVNTNDSIPLLDGRTLPIKFFIGVGSLCRRPTPGETVDCGEGTARPDENTTIVTTNGRAGTFIPAGAVDQEVTIIIESVDHSDAPCIRGLPEPTFEGTSTADGNSCYDFRTVTADGERLGGFNTPVTVGICVEVSELDEVTADLIQIFQFDVGSPIQALPNVPAPFLKCDPAFSPSFGSVRRGVLDLALARGLGSAIGPLALLAGPAQPLFAATRTTMFDLGAGGSTDDFSRFTWALPSEVTVDFDQAPDGSDVAPGTAVNSLYSRIGVTFSRTRPGAFCGGTAVYANSHGPLPGGGFGLRTGDNSVTVCPQGTASDFSDNAAGAIVAQFALPAVQACIGVAPTGFQPGSQPGAFGFIEALDASGAVLRDAAGASVRSESRPNERQPICVADPDARIAGVRFAGAGDGFAIFDNLFFARVLPPVR